MHDLTSLFEFFCVNLHQTWAWLCGFKWWRAGWVWHYIIQVQWMFYLVTENSKGPCAKLWSFARENLCVLSAAPSEDEPNGYITGGTKRITKIPRLRSHVKGNMNGREAEGMKEQKQASSVRVDRRKTIKQLLTFRVRWRGRAKQDHMSSTQRGRMGVPGPPLLKSKWSNNTQSEMIHWRKSPCLDRAERPGKDCPSAWVVPPSHSKYPGGFRRFSPSLLWLTRSTGTARCKLVCEVVFDLSATGIEWCEVHGASSCKRWIDVPKLKKKKHHVANVDGTQRSKVHFLISLGSMQI